MMKNSIALNIRLKWPEIPDDYAVWSKRREIGRIRFALDASASDRSWEWYIVIPMALPEWASGAAKDRDEAIRAFSAAWGRFLQEMQPQRLQRAWLLEDAALMRAARRGSANASPT